MKLKFIWKIKTAEYQTGQSLYLGKCCVGGYSYNASRPKGTKGDDWKGYVDLPGVREGRSLCDTEEAMRTQIESIVKVWFIEVLK
jgi:hypothetical protein